MALVKLKTNSGFECDVYTQALQSDEMVDILKSYDRNDDLDSTEMLLDVGKYLLGKKQYEKLRKHVKDEDGFVLVPDLINEITEIQELCSKQDNDVKK